MPFFNFLYNDSIEPIDANILDMNEGVLIRLTGGLSGALFSSIGKSLLTERFELYKLLMFFVDSSGLLMTLPDFEGLQNEIN